MAACIKCGTELVPEALYCHRCGKKQSPAPRKALKRPNGSGTVYKLSGRRSKPWVAAKNRVIIGYYEKKTDALSAMEKLSAKDITTRYNMTFKEVFTEWKGEHYREIGEKGAEAYDGAYKIFASLHKKKFRDLRAADFQAVIDANSKKSHSTLSKYKQLVTQMSEWAVREEICTANFAKFVKLPEAVKKEKEIFSKEDIQSLEKDGSEAAMIVLMLIYTGMRIGELFSLPLSDYHDTYVIGGEKTEAGKNRIIPIRQEGRKYFAYMANKSPGPLLINGYSGQKTIDNYRRRDYFPLLDRLNIGRKTPHATRHTYASWAREAGIRPEILQRILGHKNYQTTANIYLHADKDDLISAVDCVSNQLATEKKQEKM